MSHRKLNLFTSHTAIRLCVLALVLGLLFVPLGGGCSSDTENLPDESAVEVIQAGVMPLDSPYGQMSLEERITANQIIVRATMTSLSSQALEDDEDIYRAVLKFTFNVSEYLKGAGPSSIVAVWVDGRGYDTRAEAENRRALVLADRDDQWDTREAILFLYDNPKYGAEIRTQLQRAGHFGLAFGAEYGDDDHYSLHSEWTREWLPTISNSDSASGESTESNDAREYLLDVPSVSGGSSGSSSDSSATTITLNDLKTRISAVTAELNGGDGSEVYEECIRAKYKFERREHYFIEVLDRGRSFDDRPVESGLTSGQPANDEFYRRNNAGLYPNQKARTWFEGEDADLFAVVQGTTTPYDKNKDGNLTPGEDRIEYIETFVTARPLPAGIYQPVRKELWLGFMPCNYAISTDWTVTVTPPTGTLHEAFYDPVTIGTAVGADGTNGVIDLDEFTVSSDEYEIESLMWDEDDDEVVLTLDDHVSLSGYSLDFIELDGSIDTTLNVSDAAVSETAATWTWNLTSAPWEDGDLLMLRIRESSTP